MRTAQTGPDLRLVLSRKLQQCFKAVLSLWPVLAGTAVSGLSPQNVLSQIRNFFLICQ